MEGQSSSAEPKQGVEKSSSGIFGFGRRKPSSKKKSSRGLNGNTTSTSSRRVVKATAPPPLPDSATNTQSDSVVLVDYPDKNDDNDTSSPEKKDIGNLPSVQKEDQLEKTEQWRKERINANAAMRKENKEKDVMEHRRRSGSVENSGGGGEEANVPQPVPAILSVAPKFPEHKRKAAPDDHVGKKSRVSEDADVDVDHEEKQSTGHYWKQTIPGWVKTYGTAAAVAAAGAIIAITIFRKR